MHKAFLLLGGNLGDVPDTFSNALNLLEARGISVLRKSALYQSEPWGMESGKLFINQAVEVFTSMDPVELLNALLDIEKIFGRTRIEGQVLSRNIDIDILLFDERVVCLPELTIPHPRMHLRRFVLEPLYEIAPLARHPLLHHTIGQLLQDCTDKLKVTKLGIIV